MKTNVIVLNGTSSSGKTSLARALQSISPEVYLLCSLDAFWNMTPNHIPASSTNFPNIKLALSKSVKALAETGHNVIVDIIFSGQKTYKEITKELERVNFTIVNVECPIEELERREKERGDRTIGLAKSQIDTIHDGVVYDLNLNTSTTTPEECAQTILNSLQV